METAESPPVWLTTLIAAVFFGGLAVMAFVIDQRRRRGLEWLAEDLGLTLFDRGDQSVSLPASFFLESKRLKFGDWEAGWLMEGEIDGMSVEVFELRCIADPSTGKTHGYPVNVVRLGIGGDLPDFLIRPEGLSQRIAAALSGDDIDFSDSSLFSRRFRLRGADEGAIRRLFAPQVRAFFERRRGRISQVIGGELYHTRATRLLRWTGFRPKPVRALIREGLELASLIRSG